MIFYKIESPESVAQVIANKISEHLNKNEDVFWIVTGGSGIKICASVSRLLNGLTLKNLSVMLSDERYGPVGHPDSNWLQLEEAGFKLVGAKLIPVLNGKNLKQTAEDYANNLIKCFKKADYSIGLFGIGPDGHVAGILPGSPAVRATPLAVGYKDDEVSLSSPEGVLRGVDRLTMTPPAISKLDEAIVCAFGSSKHEALDKLKQNLTLEEQPAQALKNVKMLSIFNDYKGVRANQSLST